LEQVPVTLGDWDGEALEFAGEPPRDVAGHLYRRYLNRRTGDVVTVALFGGRPGPISIHSPDACWTGAGYQMVQPTRHEMAGPEGARAEFRTAQFVRRRAAEQTRLRIFWAWSDAGSWGVPENPRMTYAGSPVLYKLYLIRELSTDKEGPLAEDPCNDLVRSLVPELRRVLFTES
jgi:hypothetical protein